MENLKNEIDLKPFGILVSNFATIDYRLDRSNRDYYESDTNLINKILSSRTFLSNESWDDCILISARILKQNANEVICECILSLEENILEARSFPAFLFSHLGELKEYQPIQLKYSFKPGSIRTDIIDGYKLGIEKEFENSVDWSALNDFENKKF